MRGKTIVAFFSGFATGVVLLTALLWQTGNLRGMRAPTAPGVPPPIEPRPAPLPAAKPPVPATPPDQPPAQADRAVQTPTRPLLIPVQGASAVDLRDNFDEARGGHPHEALDIAAPRGTPVLATDEGNVVKLFNSKAGGLTVYQFDDSRSYCYYYAHLDRYATGLKEGTLLRQGDILGYVGSSGNAPADAPHLHFAIFKLGPEKQWWQGTAVNPYPILTGRQGLLP